MALEGGLHTNMVAMYNCVECQNLVKFVNQTVVRFKNQAAFETVVLTSTLRACLNTIAVRLHG